jgi:hypothetical protein
MQKHEKMYRCDIPGCTNRGGFARMDQLQRHQRTVEHDDAHRSKAAPAASFTGGYTETDEIAIETDDELGSKADDDFAMSSTGDESDGGCRIRDERIRAPTLRASQHPEEPPGNDDRLGSTRDSSSFEESHADMPLSRTPRQKTPVQDRDPDGSYFSTSFLHPQGESGAHGDEKSQGPMSGLKTFFGFGASKGPRRNSFDFPINHSPVRAYESERVIERERDRRRNADRLARQEARRREEEAERIRLAAVRERERRRRAQEIRRLAAEVADADARARQAEAAFLLERRLVERERVVRERQRQAEIEDRAEADAWNHRRRSVHILQQDLSKVPNSQSDTSVS